MTPQRRRWRGSWLAGAWTLVLAGCGGALGERAIVAMEGTLELPPAVARVRVEGRTASLLILPQDERKIRYEGVLRMAGDTREQLGALTAVEPVLRSEPVEGRAEDLVLRLPEMPPGADPLHSVLGVELKLFLPAAVAVAVQVEGGYLEAEDRQARVELSTGRGDLRLARCRGPAVLHTGAGTTIVHGHEGDLEVQARAGELQAFVRKPGDQIKLVTGMGNIQCFVPPETGLRVDARTEQGRVANGFGFAVQKVLEFGAVMQGTRGDGRTAVVLRSGKGMLSLTHHAFD